MRRKEKHLKPKPTTVSVSRNGKQHWVNKNVMYRPPSKLSTHADTNLPDIMYIRDLGQIRANDCDTWDTHKNPDVFAITDMQIEVGVYELRKIVKVSSIVKITEDVFDNT